jgi:formate hydrogenlyase subunit 3/multisubunit Na+/H+ antiporter MnhD subunit
MPLFAAMVQLLFSKLLLFMGLMFAKKVGLVLAGVAALTVITGALYTTLRQVIVPLAAQLFQTSYGSIIGLAFPPAAGTCILAITVVWSACGLYSWQRIAVNRITSV